MAHSDAKTKKSLAPTRRVASPSKMRHPETLAYGSAIEATESDLEMYASAVSNGRKKVTESNDMQSKRRKHGKKRESAGSYRLKNIVFGKFKMQTWYSSPYPDEYSRLTTLHLCEFCLRCTGCMMACRTHLLKCDLRHPPGREIYRNDSLSVFEVDGNLSLLYCQNVCLLSKLFLDHKTLYYDVELFLFYVLTVNDDSGCHFVGYFSKEKYNPLNHSLSCIMTLPCYQMQGYGRFLVDFSFLLMRRQGIMGTPERPLSDLGRISYMNYWLSAIFEYLHYSLDPNGPGKITIQDIAHATGISIFDIVEVMKSLGWINGDNSECVLLVNYSMVENYWKKALNNPHRLWIDESKLQWVAKKYVPYSSTKDSTLCSRGASSSKLSHKRLPPASESQQLLSSNSTYDIEGKLS